MLLSKLVLVILRHHKLSYFRRPKEGLRRPRPQAVVRETGEGGGGGGDSAMWPWGRGCPSSGVFIEEFCNDFGPKSSYFHLVLCTKLYKNNFIPFTCVTKMTWDCVTRVLGKARCCLEWSYLIIHANALFNEKCVAKPNEASARGLKQLCKAKHTRASFESIVRGSVKGGGKTSNAHLARKLSMANKFYCTDKTIDKFLVLPLNRGSRRQNKFFRVERM